LYSWPRKRFSRRVSAVVGVSRFVLDRHLDFGAFAGIPAHVIPNPCAPSRMASARTNARVLRIGYLGRVEPAKGVEQLLRAVGALKSDAWELRVAGGGVPDFAAHLRAEFSDARIQFAGIVDSDSFLRELDVLVIPSPSNETFGMVAAEA